MSNKIENKRALIISLNSKVNEISQLANSLDYQVVRVFVQNRAKPDVNSYIGSGKVDEIKDFIENYKSDIDLVVIDGELKPSQWFTLEKKLKVRVFNRIRLILEIFDERADHKEARLQVKLAQLRYEKPFVRELIHRARSGEHPGFMAGGEYQVDDYYEMIKKQMKKIRNNLDKIREDRELRRQYRHKGGFYLVSLAGYTNAGKSSLLNVLSKEDVKVEGKLFSTLSTTTRRIENEDIPILLTDTVGFIQNLPSFIVDAFHSTLEELKVADVVLLVIDASEPSEVVANKLKVSFGELREIGVETPVVIALNKIDLISKERLDELIEYINKNDLTRDNEIVPVSAKEEKNIDELLDIIYDSLPRLSRVKLELPWNEYTQSFISLVHERANVINVSYGNSVTLSFECDSRMKDKLISKCKNLNGKVLKDK